jgi:hypothetical protein
MIYFTSRFPRDLPVEISIQTSALGPFLPRLTMVSSIDGGKIGKGRMDFAEQYNSNINATI